ncbi:dihydrofolate reductase [Agromyces sp. G08B096]|uniref:Dihydrofolate reductase n=1 Tax=Agromyces sp. G08B096 TaxID=3156399 RepID=A0AAU7W3E5_9MICO
MSRPRVGLVWAEAEGGVIGRAGGMPWHVPEDLAHFKAVTHGAPVIMGRSTWDSLPPRFTPLPGRANIVVTRQHDWQAAGAERAGSVDEALELAGASAPDWIWVIGGAQIFAEVLGRADRLEITELRHDEGAFAPAPGDVLAPLVDATHFALVAADPSDGAHTSASGIRYRFLRYDRV